MQIYTIRAENFKMDGGACFGVVPKSIWSKYVEPDENNMIKASNRCLLVKTEKKLILFDCGMGNKQDQKYFDNFYVFGPETLENSIKKLGFSFDGITDVVFTHLHFDHCGGAVRYADAEKTKTELVFKNAFYHCSKAQWNWAVEPNAREKASYFRENFIPILESGKLHLIDNELEFGKNIHFRFFNGHTEGQIVPIIDYNGNKIVFAADFIASSAHVPLAYIPSYDVQPLISLKEKENFLKEAVSNNYILVFEHDYDNEACTLKQTEKGIRVNEIFNLKDYFERKNS